MPMNRIVTFIFSMLFAMVTLQGNARSSVEIIDQDNGQTLEVYNIAGVKVMAIKVEGQDKRFDLNLPKGCYIVKVGKVVRKISIK